MSTRVPDHSPALTRAQFIDSAMGAVAALVLGLTGSPALALEGFCQGSRQRLWPTRAGLAMSRLLQRGVDEDAVLGMRVGRGDQATGAHRPGLSPVPLPRV